MGRKLTADILVDQIIFDPGDAGEVLPVGKGTILDLDLLFLRQLAKQVPGN